MYKIIYPLLECRSWLSFYFFSEEEGLPDPYVFHLIVFKLIYVIGIIIIFFFKLWQALLLNAALPYCNPA